MNTLSRATAQIIIQLNPETGEFGAELPSPNGSRRKINLNGIHPRLWGDTIQQELLQLNFWLRDQEKNKEQDLKLKERDLKLSRVAFSHAMHRRNWDNTAASHNKGQESGEDFANRTVGLRRSATVLNLNIAQILDQDQKKGKKSKK